MRDIMAEIIAQMLGGSKTKVWIDGNIPEVVGKIHPNGSTDYPGASHAYVWVHTYKDNREFWKKVKGGRAVPFNEITTRLKIRKESDNE